MGNEASRQAEAPSQPNAPMGSIRRMDKAIRKKVRGEITYNMKILVRGARGTGKSSLLARLQGLPIPEEHIPTREIETSTINWSMKHSEEGVKCEVWDVVDHGIPADENDDEIDPDSQGRHHVALVDAQNVDVYQNAHGVIFLMDITNYSTLEYVKSQLDVVPVHIPTLVIGTFRDLRRGNIPLKRAVFKEDVQSLLYGSPKDHKNPSFRRPHEQHYFEASLTNCYGLKSLHSYLGIPFLHLKVATVKQQLRLLEVELTNVKHDVDVTIANQKYSHFVSNIAGADIRTGRRLVSRTSTGSTLADSTTSTNEDEETKEDASVIPPPPSPPTPNPVTTVIATPRALPVPELNEDEVEDLPERGETLEAPEPHIPLRIEHAKTKQSSPKKSTKQPKSSSAFVAAKTVDAPRRSWDKNETLEDFTVKTDIDMFYSDEESDEDEEDQDVVVRTVGANQRIYRKQDFLYSDSEDDEDGPEREVPTSVPAYISVPKPTPSVDKNQLDSDEEERRSAAPKYKTKSTTSTESEAKQSLDSKAALSSDEEQHRRNGGIKRKPQVETKIPVTQHDTRAVKPQVEIASDESNDDEVVSSSSKVSVQKVAKACTENVSDASDDEELATASSATNGQHEIKSRLVVASDESDVEEAAQRVSGQALVEAKDIVPHHTNKQSNVKQIHDDAVHDYPEEDTSEHVQIAAKSAQSSITSDEVAASKDDSRYIDDHGDISKREDVSSKDVESETSDNEDEKRQSPRGSYRNHRSESFDDKNEDVSDFKPNATLSFSDDDDDKETQEDTSSRILSKQIQQDSSDESDIESYQNPVVFDDEIEEKTIHISQPAKALNGNRVEYSDDDVSAVPATPTLKAESSESGGEIVRPAKKSPKKKLKAKTSRRADVQVIPSDSESDTNIQTNGNSTNMTDKSLENSVAPSFSSVDISPKESPKHPTQYDQLDESDDDVPPRYESITTKPVNEEVTDMPSLMVVNVATSQTVSIPSPSKPKAPTKSTKSRMQMLDSGSDSSPIVLTKKTPIVRNRRASSGENEFVVKSQNTSFWSDDDSDKEYPSVIVSAPPVSKPVPSQSVPPTPPPVQMNSNVLAAIEEAKRAALAMLEVDPVVSISSIDIEPKKKKISKIKKNEKREIKKSKSRMEVLGSDED